MAPSSHSRPPRIASLPLPVTTAALPALSLSACYSLRPSQGGGEIPGKQARSPREIDPADIALPKGYRIEAAATGLTFPAGVAFDDTGGIFVIESGYVYGETPE